jgi:hypothetical protein
VEKYGKAGQATYDVTTRRMRIARWINKATHAHTEFVIFIAFSHVKNGNITAPQNCVYTHAVLFFPKTNDLL